MKDKQMIIRAGICGTVDECEIGLTEKEWDALSEDEQGATIREWLPNVVDICVVPEGR